MASQLEFAGGTFIDGLVPDAEDPRRVADAAAVESHCRLVIAFVGLAFEAKIAEAPGVQVVCRTAGSQLETLAESAVRQGYRGMISFGVAGGLASHLRAGDWVVASSIREQHLVRPTDAVWSRKLLGMVDGAIHAPIVGVDTPIAEPAKKRELHKATGAAAVDMESHVVARVAAKHKLVFAALPPGPQVSPDTKRDAFGPWRRARRWNEPYGNPERRCREVFLFFYGCSHTLATCITKGFPVYSAALDVEES
jgi:Phosphorylase superfamily